MTALPTPQNPQVFLQILPMSTGNDSHIPISFHSAHCSAPLWSEHDSTVGSWVAGKKGVVLETTGLGPHVPHTSLDSLQYYTGAPRPPPPHTHITSAPHAHATRVHHTRTPYTYFLCLCLLLYYYLWYKIQENIVGISNACHTTIE